LGIPAASKNARNTTTKRDYSLHIELISVKILICGHLAKSGYSDIEKIDRSRSHAMSVIVVSWSITGEYLIKGSRDQSY